MIHLLDANERIIDVLANQSDKVYWDSKITEDQQDNLLTLDFTTLGTIDFTNVRKLTAQDQDGNHRLFVLSDIEKDHDENGLVQIIHADGDHISLAQDQPIAPTTLEGATAETAAQYILTNSRYKLGQVDFLGSRTVKFTDFLSPLAALNQIASDFDAILRFRVEIIGNTIQRYVDILEPIDIFSGKEFVFGKDIVGLKRKENRANIVTRLVGYGPADEDGNFVTFESINDGKNYVEDADAYQRWNDGGRHRYGIFQYQPEDTTDVTPQKVLDATKDALKRRNDAAVEYELTGAALEQIMGYEHEKVRVGMTIRIKDTYFEPALYLEAEVLRTEMPEYGDPNGEFAYTFGNYREVNISIPDDIKRIQSILMKHQTRWTVAKDIADDAKQSAETAQQTADSKNKSSYGHEPPSDPKTGDIWFVTDANGEVTAIRHWDGTQWVDDVDNVAVQQAIDEANQAAANAQQVGEQAQQTADNAVQVAQAAQQAAEAAQNAANQAQQDANDAKTQAQNAVDTANQALTDAQTAIDQAQTAFDNAQNALATANDASDVANNASQIASDAATQASSALTQAQNAMSEAQKKADASSVYTKTEIDNALQSYATTTTVDTLTGRVDSAETAIQQNANTIALKADQSTVDTLTGRVSTAEATLAAQADQIAARITKADADAKYATQTALTATANSLTSSITAVQTDLNNLQIGGRNWALVTGIAQSMTGNGGVNQTKNLYSIAGGSFLPLAGKQVTISFDWEVTGTDSPSGKIYIQGSNPWPRITNDIIFSPTNKSGHYVGTITITESVANFSSLNFRMDNVPTNVTFTVTNLKLELGNRATDWTPAPEDMATVTQFNTLSQTLDSTTSRIGNAEGNISALQQTASSLGTRITDAEGDISTLTQTVDGLQTTVSDVQGDVSTLTQTADSLQTRMTDAEGNISTLTQTTDSLTSQINTKADQSWVSSQISQLSDDINLRVSKNDVINQINISTEGILIDGAKVHITGQTTIDNAVIKDAMIASLSASKLTAGTIDASVITVKNINASNIITGTLDASKVTVANIDASKISTGTLNAARIAAGSIDASKLSVTSLSAISANLGNVTAGNITGVTMNLAGGKFTVDSDGNVTFSGILSGAIGKFAGDLSAARVEIGPDSPDVGWWSDGSIGLSFKMPIRISDGVYTWGTPLDLKMLNGEATFEGANKIVFHPLFSPKGGIETEAWHTVTTFQNGWSAYDATNFPVQYMKDPMGFVHLRGLVGGGTQGYNTVFTLPAGYRPQYPEYFGTTQSNIDYVPRIEVTTNGNVYVVNGGTSYTSLSGITFYAGW